MTLEQITALAVKGESETLEFKSTTGTRREAAQTVCAMLNQCGGHVLFGVTATGDVAGQQVSAEIQRIDPPAFPAVERIHVAGDLEVVAVRVSQGSARPYQYRGTAYRRVGNTTLAMSADEYNYFWITANGPSVLFVNVLQAQSQSSLRLKRMHGAVPGVAFLITFPRAAELAGLSSGAA